MQATSANSGPSAMQLAAVPLFHAAWLFAAGIVIANWIWLRPSLVLIAVAAMAYLCALTVLRAQRIAWIPMAILWLLLGAWCEEMEPHPAPAAPLAALSDGLMRSVEGTVVDAGSVRTEAEQNVDEPTAARPSQRMDLRVENVEVVGDESDAQAAVSGGVRVTVRWPDETPGATRVQGFQCGDRVRAAVRMLPPERYRDPGVWNRADYLVDQGITSTGSATADRVERIGRAPGAFLSCRLKSWQQDSTARLILLPRAMRGFPPALRLSEDDAVMLAAMVAGDRTYLTHGLRVGFERTGSFHMLVVSGFHLAIVAACILWIARRLRVPRVPATLVTITASFAYALFTGFATPVQRSLWMVTLYLLGRLVYRERNALNTIGFAALCLLAVSPRSLFDSSLQMTLLAVIAIAGVAAPLLQGTIHPFLNATRDLRLVAIDVKLVPKVAQFRVAMRMIAVRLDQAASRVIAWRVFPWTLRYLIRVVEMLVVSCVVELAMTLPMAVYFHRITIFALPVNLLILPLLMVLMPAALLALLALWIWQAAAVVPAAVAAVVLHFGVRMVHLFGSMALGDFRIPNPLPWQSALFVVLLGAAIVLALQSVGRAGQWLRLGAWAAMALAALIAVMPRPIERPRGAMLMEAIDVGQGDSLLLITPDGKTLLIDGGGFGGGPREGSQSEVAHHFTDEDLSAGAPDDHPTDKEPSPGVPDDGFDIGEEVVSPALWARGIRHLDAVALSHAHSDHMGGLPAVLRNFHPDELWVGNNPRVNAYNALLDEAAALHVRVRSFRAGDGFAFGSTRVNVLAPFRDYQPGAEPANNDSLVLRVAYGQTSVMLEGDAESPIEQAMLTEPDLASTLLKVGHHGSITSTRPEFLKRVAPQWAVISCGLHNRYGHPRQEVLEELEEAHVQTFRTDIDGISCFRLDGKSAAAEPECGGR